ncbi:MAG TPA: CDP-diacylglycerol--glycerol-3-phosphate 3-phosphatidyltransferase [Burkholderiales bacterium]|nr:CDP-diacylglycerol--glycerol-3-phosphate 3-phosphatidyltransferase [Burkholderiales bacterium]
MPVNIPILLTWARIVMIPLVVGVFYFPDDWLSYWGRNFTATVLFTLAAITDWLDGWLARKLGQTSAFGAFLDPVADKLMVAASLIILVALGRLGDSNAVVAVIIIGREIAISALREWMAKSGQSASVAVNMLGKIKTISQMIAIPLLLYFEPLHFGTVTLDTGALGLWLAYLAAALTLISMFYYLKMAGPIASERKAGNLPMGGDRRMGRDRRG